jgi:RimJ/RimL family protein N-acetyltransferase
LRTIGKMSEKYRLPEEFRTNRFLVRRIVPSDAQAIFDGWNTDPEVTRYLTWRPHSDLHQTREAVDHNHREWDTGASFPAVICLRDQPNELIGRVDVRPAGHKVSYGWLVRRDRWGDGVASEVVTWVVEHALSHPLIFRAEASCDVMNRASARVMENAGMTKEALLQRYLLHPNISDIPRDAFLYSKVR